jgi:hypothetical protein
MSARARPDGARSFRVLLLVLLGAAPLLAGAVHEPVFIPLLAGCAVAGVAAHVRARRERERAPLPGCRLILALHALVVVQLVPLPPALLRVVSPGSFSFYNDAPQRRSRRSRSAEPARHLRGLASGRLLPPVRRGLPRRAQAQERAQRLAGARGGTGPFSAPT